MATRVSARQDVPSHRQLYEAERRRRQELEVLAQVSEAVVSCRYLDEILHLIVTVTAELMGSTICSLMLLDEGRQELVIRATQSLSAAYRTKPPIKVGQSISGEVVRQRRAIAVADVTKDPRFMFPQIAKQERLRSLLSVPMITRGQVIGVLNCYTPHAHQFTSDEIRTLTTIANAAAAAIERTRLLDEAVAARNELAERKLVEKAKGVLMERARLSEREAFRLLQRESMAKRRSMKQIAEAILLAEDVQTNSLTLAAGSRYSAPVDSKMNRAGQRRSS